MKRHSSFVKRALSFEKKGILRDIEDICPTDKIGDHLGQSKINFKRIVRASGLLAIEHVPSFKAQ